MPITILDGALHPFATIEEGLPDYEKCPVCDMYFVQMSNRDDIEAHINRCVASRAEENRQAVAAGYKLTSMGRVLAK